MFQRKIILVSLVALTFLLAFSGCDNDFLIKNKNSIVKILVNHKWKEVSYTDNSETRDFNEWLFTKDGKVSITFYHYAGRIGYDTVNANYEVKSRVLNARMKIDGDSAQIRKYPIIRAIKGSSAGSGSNDGRWKIITLKKVKDKFVLRMARTGGQPDPKTANTTILGGIVMLEFTADL